MDLPEKPEEIISWLINQSETNNHAFYLANNLIEDFNPDMMSNYMLDQPPGEISAKIIYALFYSSPEPEEKLIGRTHVYLKNVESYTGDQAKKELIRIYGLGAAQLLSSLFEERLSGEKKEASINQLRRLNSEQIMKLLERHKRQKLLLSGLMTKVIAHALSRLHVDRIEERKNIELSSYQREKLRKKIHEQIKVPILVMKAKLLEMHSIEFKSGL